MNEDNYSCLLPFCHFIHKIIKKEKKARSGERLTLGVYSSLSDNSSRAFKNIVSGGFLHHLLIVDFFFLLFI
jgi:hypothetical protein